MMSKLKIHILKFEDRKRTKKEREDKREGERIREKEGRL